MIYDVIVIGAGPAGCMAATTLGKKGMHVLLIDKDRFPRDKSCGGGLPLRTLIQYPFLKDLDIIESTTYGGYLYSPSLKYKVKIIYDEPIIAMVLRNRFDEALAHHAMKNGAEFRDGMAATHIEIKKDGVVVTLKDDSQVHAQMIIGADGFNSITTQKIGLHDRNRNRAISIVEEFPLSKEMIKKYYNEERFIHIHSALKGLQGYGWVFPKKDHINIGIIDYQINNTFATSKYGIRDFFKSYLSLLREEGIIPNDIVSNKLRGGVLPVSPLEKTYADRALICGDAAGFINPVSGEGIYYAIRSGEIAANVAIEALKGKDLSEGFLAKYEQIWKKDFGREIKMMLRSKKRWRKKSEKTIKLMHSDKKLAELLYLTMVGKESMYNLRWKIAPRYVYCYMKQIFHRHS